MIILLEHVRKQNNVSESNLFLGIRNDFIGDI